MEICGDFVELNEREQNSESEDTSDLQNIQWEIKEGGKIPQEVFSLYSVESGKITINDVSVEILDGIKNSKYSRVTGHIHTYEEMFFIFFEFAIERYEKEFETVHFGIVPTENFFEALEKDQVIKIRDVNFTLTDYRKKKLSDKWTEFHNKYPDADQ